MDMKKCNQKDCRHYDCFTRDCALHTKNAQACMNTGLRHYKPLKKESDPVNHPDHYTDGGIETIDYMKAKSTPEEFRGYLKCTVIKYISRAGKKVNTIEDLKKARWYLDKLIEEVEAHGDPTSESAKE